MTIFTRTLFLLAAAIAPLAPAAPPPAQRSIEIWSVDPIAIDIEWLTIDEKGNAEVTARRATVIGPPVPLAFTDGRDRYIRFSYQGASPRTYSTADLAAVRKLHVPDVLPGGELLVLVPEAAVRPVRVRLEGPVPRAADVTASIATSFAGLPEGEYTIVPIYEGGILGKVQTATVRTAHTALVPHPTEAVGAVRIVASHDACGSATELGINQIVVPRVGSDIKGPPSRMRWASTKEPQCEMRFGGLRPGQFEVFYRRGAAPAGSASFSIEPQAWTTAEVASPAIRLGGRVTINGRPAADARVRVTPRSTSSPIPPIAAEATTDPSGNYSVTLETPGTYTVTATRPRTLFASRNEITILEGANVYDIAVTGGRIVVDIKGWDPRVRLQVSIRTANAGGPMMVSAFEGREKPPAFEGLPFGEYLVSVSPAQASRARQATAQALREIQRNTQRVLLTEASPEATLTFDVSKH